MSVEFKDTSLRNIIEMKNVSHTYDEGETFVLKNLNLLIEDKPGQGQFSVVLGPSGCGKSTLLRYLAGLQEPTSGEVLVNGKPWDSNNNTSMVFQKYSSLPWLTVLDNVALGLKFKGVAKKERLEKAMEMIQLVGLDGHERKYAQYPNLSGGQLQRVAIARSLLVNPDILLMDEPFGALDIKIRLDMQNLLAELWRKFELTIIFVTHDISEAVYLGDEIFIMSTSPAQIIERVPISLSLNRSREIKRDREFVDLVYDIEDKMMKIDTGVTI